MGQTYSQLTEGERNQFYALRQAKMPINEIANQLDRSRTTLYNELNRNRGGRGYRPRQAQQVAEKRRAEKVSPHVVNDAVDPRAAGNLPHTLPDVLLLIVNYNVGT